MPLLARGAAGAVAGHVGDVDHAAEEAIGARRDQQLRVGLAGEAPDAGEQLVVARLLVGGGEAGEAGVDRHHELAEGVVLVGAGGPDDEVARVGWHRDRR